VASPYTRMRPRRQARSRSTCVPSTSTSSALPATRCTAPKGVGVLYRRRGVELEKLIHGASHEQNMRLEPRTCSRLSDSGRPARSPPGTSSKAVCACPGCGNLLQTRILERVPDCRINGHRARGSKHALDCVRGIEAGTLMAEIDHIACSAGAACHADKVTMSHVLEAMGCRRTSPWALSGSRSAG